MTRTRHARMVRRPLPSPRTTATSTACAFWRRLVPSNIGAVEVRAGFFPLKKKCRQQSQRPFRPQPLTHRRAQGEAIISHSTCPPPLMRVFPCGIPMYFFCCRAGGPRMAPARPAAWGHACAPPAADAAARAARWGAAARRAAAAAGAYRMRPLSPAAAPLPRRARVALRPAAQTQGFGDARRWRARGRRAARGAARGLPLLHVRSETTLRAFVPPSFPGHGTARSDGRPPRDGSPGGDRSDWGAPRAWYAHARGCRGRFVECTVMAAGCELPAGSCARARRLVWRPEATRLACGGCVWRARGLGRARATMAPGRARHLV